MITKYIIDLRQFNNGESDKITFPTFDQCLMYGIYKLKAAIKKGTSIVQAVLIEDSQDRKIVISPSLKELELVEVDPSTLQWEYDGDDVKIQIHHNDDEDCNWISL